MCLILRKLCWFLPSCQKASTVENIRIIVLGASGCGKTEILHVLSKKKRFDLHPTTGVRHIQYELGGSILTDILEIGGGSGLTKMWHHYYSSTYAIIYVFDFSDNENLEKSLSQLSEIVSHQFVRGKPILVLANKMDLSDNSDIIDCYERFPLESIANANRTPILLQPCGHDNYSDLPEAMSWLHSQIEKNLSELRARVDFDMETEERNKKQRMESSNRRRFLRSNHRKKRIKPPDFEYSRRAKSAPATLGTKVKHSLRENRIHPIGDSIVNRIIEIQTDPKVIIEQGQDIIVEKF